MKYLKKITAFTLVTSILLFGLGFSTCKMVCLKSGKTKISFNHLANCCNKKSPDNTTVKSNCCDISNFIWGLDNYSASEKVNIPNTVFGTFHEVLRLIYSNNSVNENSAFHAETSPPNLYGRSLLTFISTLII